MSGYFDALIYVLLASVAFVFLDRLCNDINPVVALFIMSGIAIICFNLLSFKYLKLTYTAIKNNFFLFLLMSFSLSIDWLCMIYATFFSDPFIAMAAVFVTTALLGFAKYYWDIQDNSSLLSITFLVISMLVLYFGYQIRDPKNIGYGIFLGCITGAAFFIYIVSSRILARRANLSSIQLLATRFWILFIGSAFFINLKDVSLAFQEKAFSLILVSLASLVVPIYFNQQAINKLGSAKAAILFCFVPPATYLFYVLWNHNLKTYNLMVCFIITFALISPNIFKYMKK